MRKLLTLLLLCTLSSCGGNTPAFAEYGVPQGWVEFCQREADLQCQPQIKATVPASNEWLVQIAMINIAINGRYIPAEDWDVYGHLDYWTYPKGDFADCEDFVLAKIETLAQAGIPRGAMSIIIGFLQNGEGHAVLGVHLSDGRIIVLDSLHNRILPLEQARYLKLHMMQLHGNPMIWKKLW